MNVFLTVVIWIAALAAAAVIIGGAVLFFVFFTRKRKGSKRAAMKFQNEACEEADRACGEFLKKELPVETVKSADGLLLYALVYPAEDMRCAVVAMHGYHSSGARDFAGMADFYHGMGCTLVLPDERAHGRSEGRFLTLGDKERFDVRLWVKKVNELYPGVPVVLHGISMGAEAVLMAAGEGPMENVAGIVADCGYTSPRDILTYVGRRWLHLPAELLMPGFSVICRVAGGFHIYGGGAEEAMRRDTDVPVLFIHGTADGFVPREMGERNFEACRAKKKLVLVDGAHHAMSWSTDTALYKRELSEFIEECLKNRR